MKYMDLITESRYINPTSESLERLRFISKEMKGKTFHHHSHILHDIQIKENGYYVEIGCYCGATACLMIDKANVVSIDLGHPIPMNIVQENVNLFNTNQKSFDYLEGNSQSEDMVERLKKITKEIDILFIDGDHSKDGVIKDFNLYSDLVVSGGYIVFDDYNDHEYSPEVKPAVDSIIENLTDYDIVGTITNTLGARPRTLIEGNCFVLRKK